MSTFTTIQTALSGLMAQQTALQVAGQNVANANTPGYHRQEAVLQAQSSPQVGGTGSSRASVLGSGVDVTSINRLQGSFLQQQTLTADSQVGQWNLSQSTLQQIQSIISPGTGTDLSSSLSNFFSAWQQLAAEPSDETERSAVQSAGESLTSTLNGMATSLQQLATETSSGLQTRVDSINTLASSIASLNGQIASATAQGTQPNDLLDQRTQDLQQLAGLADVTTLTQNDPNGNISLGGHTLVQGTSVNQITLTQGDGGQQLVWSNDGSAVQVNSGEVASILNMQNTTIPAYQQQLDSIASALSTSVNSLHETGVTMDNAAAGAFFDGDTAATIQLDSSITQNVRNIAATATADAPGDGSLATSISNIANSTLVGGQTLQASADSMIGTIGNAVSSAGNNVTTNQALSTQLANQESSVSGVSLDEELSSIMVYQRAYQASAQVMTVCGDMMDSLLAIIGQTT